MIKPRSVTMAERRRNNDTGTSHHHRSAVIAFLGYQPQQQQRRRRRKHSNKRLLLLEDRRILVLLILIVITQLNQYMFWNFQGSIASSFSSKRHIRSNGNGNDEKSFQETTSSSSSIKSLRIRKTNMSLYKHDYTYNVFVYVRAFGEGISAWRLSVAQLLAFAKSANATLVEPCMKDGRLGSCEHRHQDQKVPISQIFDMSLAFDPTSLDDSSIVTSPPLMISYEDFLKRTTTKSSSAKVSPGPSNNTNTTTNKIRYDNDNNRDDNEDLVRIKVCLTPFKKTCYAVNYFEVPGAQQFYEQQSSIWWAEKILKYQNNIDGDDENNIESTDSPVIIDVLQYWRNGFCLADNQTIDSISNEYLNFHPNQINKVDRLLEKVNIVGPENKFSVIHWRAEKDGIDYMKCAKAIVETRHEMTNIDDGEDNNNNHSQFLLMTSLNNNPEVMWEGSRNITYAVNNQTAKEARIALNYLLKQKGFIKIDDLISDENGQNQNNANRIDSGMLAIWDLILASKAYHFSTCARKDAATDGYDPTQSPACASPLSRQMCEECNHIGKFAQLAINFRKEQGKRSYGCWPQ